MRVCMRMLVVQFGRQRFHIQVQPSPAATLKTLTVQFRRILYSNFPRSTAPCSLFTQLMPDRTAAAVDRSYLSTVRAFNGWTGRLLAKPIDLENCSTCAFETVAGLFRTSHQTPSEHGGVVSEPLKR